MLDSLAERAAINSQPLLKKDDKEGRLAARNKIEEYESALKSLLGSDKGDMEDINDNGLKEYFVGGAYTRSLFIPKDTTIVSKLWNKERLWVIVSGEVTITSELGTRRVKAPHITIAPFGSKIALYTHEDTLWLAITGAESTNSEDVEKELIVENYDEITYPWDLLEHKGEDV